MSSEELLYKKQNMLALPYLGYSGDGQGLIPDVTTSCLKDKIWQWLLPISLIVRSVVLLCNGQVVLPYNPPVGGNCKSTYYLKLFNIKPFMPQNWLT